MKKAARTILATFTLLLLASVRVYGADAGEPASRPSARANVLIIGASSLVGQAELVQAMLESREIHMNIEGTWVQLDAVNKMLSSRPSWDYVIMDAWHFGRGRTAPPDFSKAVAGFVKEVRAHSPRCKIILFPWWIPFGPTATNEGVMQVFHRCAEEAKANNIWVATTGPAFMEARLARPDLHIIRSKTDAHPGIHGSYINACSLFALLSGQSPVGLPSTLTIPATGAFPAATQPKNRPPAGKAEFTIAPEDAKYLQEVAWNVYQREIKNTKPTAGE